ncbi:hypothetical protein S1OALGB6SA_2396 [Olavius algarvensis spirochete endosymbiont]|uniref:tetratricopeptide repeat protein n=1 Tax=Olavius algarvensis spirochete endosymbiont TaxID=260710 RepID=UPI0009DE9C18|nr:tetratricopeptide repeat protein [Olavius algarvensis spirochete endosymbiont]VDB01294.1 hypothetical protein S1OALGB6SA_2396 [Olavius algarvensis spirochete endosymbiont]
MMTVCEDSLGSAAVPAGSKSTITQITWSNVGIIKGWRAINLGFVVLSILMLFACQTWSTRKERAIEAYNQGNKLREAGRTLDSISYYKQALEYEPEMAAAAYNLALVLAAASDSHADSSDRNTSLSKKNVEESLELLRSLLRRDPQNLTVLRALGWVSWKSNQLDVALEYYQAVLAVFPADEIVLRAICEIYETMHEPEKALKNRKLLVKLANNAESRINLAKTTALLGNKQEALKLYDDALFYGESIQALEGAAEISEELGLYRESVGYRIRLLDVGENSTENWWHIARLRLAKIYDYEKGFEALEQALNKGFADKELIEELARETPVAVGETIRKAFETKLEK